MERECAQVQRRWSRAPTDRRTQAGAALIDALLQDWPAAEREAFAGYFARFADQLDNRNQP